MNPSRRLVTLTTVAALTFAACGSSADTVNESTTTTTASTSTSTSTTSSPTTTAVPTTAAPSTSSSTTAPTSTTTPTETAACSADGFVVNDQKPQGDLPLEVAAMRTQILQAASACDFARLGELAMANSTAYSFGGGVDPGGYWRDAEANGQDPLVSMVQLLSLEPARFDVGEGNVFYVWPAVYALPNWSEATEAQRLELTDIFGADELADWDQFESYLGYRIGITTDGRWTFFLAGD